MGLLVLGGVVLLALAVYLWWNRSALYVASATRAFGRGDEGRTLALFAKAEAAGRLSVDATVSYAYLALKHGLVETAEELLVRALDHGRRGRALNERQRRLVETYRALVLWKRGRLDDAVALLEGLLDQGYRTTAVYGNLGYFLTLQKRWDRAEEVCREAESWDPDGKVILDNLGGLLLAQERWVEAAEVYDRLLALDPSFPEAWAGAGWAAFRTGHPAEARRRWTRALELPFHSLTTATKEDLETALAMV